MACPCKTNKQTGQPAVYTVQLPGGKTKVYSSPIAAAALAKETPGAIVIPPPGVAV